MKRYASLYQNELLNQVIPFWENHSVDNQEGGFFTCIKDNGKIYDTDKYIWLQARQTWVFSKLYLTVQKKRQWRDLALHGAKFLLQHGRDTHGSWYFSVTREGAPLVQPYNIFSDCFAAMAFGILHLVEPRAGYDQVAKETFENILRRKDNPKGIYNKQYPGTRSLQNFALPMILCNLALELEHLLGPERVSTLGHSIAQLILQDFVHPESGLILENIGPNGGFVDSFEGRLLNPGHALEALWFLMDLGQRFGDGQLITRAAALVFMQLEHGWDQTHGGIFYFMDIKGHPPQQLEWDQKLWWVHLEALVALAKVHALSPSEQSQTWFTKVHDYTWKHFRDAVHGGEWYGYLNRRGEILLPLKGGKWKGCFHVPRALLLLWNTFETMENPSTKRT